MENIEDLRTKIKLMYFGLALSKEAENEIFFGDKLFIDTTYYTTTSGLRIKCYGKNMFWVNAPVVVESVFVLDYDFGKFYVKGDGKKMEVALAPLPAYYNKNDSKGRKYADMMMTQTDRVNVFPIVGCSYRCQFCPISYTEKYGTTYSLEDYGRAIEVAFKDPLVPARHIQITGGVPQLKDFKYFQDIMEGIAGNFSGVPVDLMMAPRKGLLNFRKLKKAGLNGISLNMELFGEEFTKELTFGKYQDIGKRGYLGAIENAVEIFGRGNVRSALLVGLEPIEDTLSGVLAIAKRGADPILSPFVPDTATPLKKRKKPSIETLEEVYVKARKIADKYDVKIGPRCLECQHNVLAIPY